MQYVRDLILTIDMFYVFVVMWVTFILLLYPFITIMTKHEKAVREDCNAIRKEQEKNANI